MTVTAPITGEILQCKVRVGEYAQAGPLAQPLMLMGDTSHLNVRADIDEQDAWRVRSGADAVASARGDGNKRFPLFFLRRRFGARRIEAIAGFESKHARPLRRTGEYDRYNRRSRGG